MVDEQPEQKVYRIKKVDSPEQGVLYSALDRECGGAERHIHIFPRGENFPGFLVQLINHLSKTRNDLYRFEYFATSPLSCDEQRALEGLVSMHNSLVTIKYNLKDALETIK